MGRTRGVSMKSLPEQFTMFDEISCKPAADSSMPVTIPETNQPPLKKKKIIVFEKEFNGVKIRVFKADNMEWFVAKDVCLAIGIIITGHAFSDFPEKEKGRYTIPTLG
jgi:hypothetical protein